MPHFCTAAGAVALGVTVAQWWAIPPLDDSGGLGWVSPDPGSTTGVGDIVRDQLVIVYLDGLTHDVDWGLLAGMATMALLTVRLWLVAPDPTKTEVGDSDQPPT